MSTQKRRWPRYLIAFLVATLLLIPLQAASVYTEGTNLQVIDENVVEIDQNSLPSADTDVERLTPRQYLYIFHPEYAKSINRIITCESGWVADARNGHSTASGLAQFIDGTWISTRLSMGRDPSLSLKLDPYENIDTAVWLLKNSGIQHWAASKNCHKLM